MRINEKNYKQYIDEGGELNFEAWATRIKDLRKERRRQKIKEWQANNKDKLKQYSRNYRARHGSGSGYLGEIAPVDYEQEIDEDIKEKYGDQAAKAQILKDWGEPEERIEEAMKECQKQ